MSSTAATPLTLQTLRAHRADILGAAECHGARNVRVFGSVARGEADAGSDADFLVDMDRGRSLVDLGAFLMDLQDLLGRRVNVATSASLKDRIRSLVLREAVSL
jgi:predicted nucleotidyltransferase